MALSGPENRCNKLTTRDLPLFLASTNNNPNQWGATTVASTMHLAHLAGISIFVTGGTGGVHRGVESTMDISADLIELSRTPVIVISAGIKSILDIPKTLEVLETQSVPVTVYKGDEMPAFYSGSSGIRAPSIVHSASEVADAYWKMNGLGLQSGMLVAVPNDSTGGEKVEEAIQLVLKEVENLGLEGRDVTPYILKRVAEVTGGESLKSNIELVKRNAQVGADIAIEVAKWKQINEKGSQSILMNATSSRKEQKTKIPKGKVIVMGGAVVDIIAKPALGQELIPSTSNPGDCSESEGGVGRNIAEVLGRLGTSPLFYTAVGKDTRGKALLSHLEEQCHVSIHTHDEDDGKDLDDTVSIIEGKNTATYLAVLNGEGDLHTAIADMKVLSHIPKPLPMDWNNVQYFILDANPPLETMLEASKTAVEQNVKVFWDPTSVPKAQIGAANSEFLSCLTYASPNQDELIAMAQASGWITSKSSEDDTIKEAAQFLLEKMNPKADVHLIITLGEKGVLLASRYSSFTSLEYTYFEIEAKTIVENCTGAGDTLSGAFVCALLEGMDEKAAVRVGMEAAIMSIHCVDRAISPFLDKTKLFK